MSKASFPKRLRILRSAEFDAVFAMKCSAADRMLIVYARPNPLGHARLGLVVSRKVGGAVRRNRWKRLLREAFRLSQHDLPAVDLVCLPKFRGEPTLDSLSKSLKALGERLEAKVKKSAANQTTKREEPK